MSLITVSSDSADDFTMPQTELGEIEPQECMQCGIGIRRQISAGEPGDGLVVKPLAVGMDGITALVTTKVAVELRADVEQFVEQRHETRRHLGLGQLERRIPGDDRLQQPVDFAHSP